jgi:DNA invertase Pin-like site-specific DNA recombinase
MTRAAIYARLSKDAEQRGLSVARQERECRALASQEGLELVDVYVDDDLSAYNRRRPRPAYLRLLEDVEAGRVEVILARHEDRLLRDIREGEDLIDLVERTKVRVVLLDGHVNLNSARGRSDFRSAINRARYESERKSERLKLTHSALAAQGRFHGGRRPYGYRPVGDGQLAVVSEEAEVVREAARRVLAGETLYGLCQDLNARCVPSARGTGWRTPSLKRILTSWTVVGRREHRGEDAGPATWPALLDEGTWQALRNTLLQPHAVRSGGRPPVNLLAGGIARCGICGGRLYGQRKSTSRSARRVYVCPSSRNPDKPEGCGGVSINADPLEEWVTAAVLTALDSPALAQATRPSPDHDDSQVRLLEARLDELMDMYTTGEVDRPLFLRGQAKLQAELQAEQRRLARDARDRARLALPRNGELRGRWAALTLTERRAVLDAVLDQVIIRPAGQRGPVFHRDRVQLSWLS